MFLVQCNYPGCQEHARFPGNKLNWNCGQHVAPAQKPESKWRRYLPSRHPHRKQQQDNEQ